MSGRCRDLDHVPGRVNEPDGEPRHLAGVVASLADTAAVLTGGGSAGGEGLDVVQVPDRGVAERVAALLIAVDQQPSEHAIEPAASRVAVFDDAGDRVGEQPAQEDPSPRDSTGLRLTR
jgi:hypothetical protein